MFLSYKCLRILVIKVTFLLKLASQNVNKSFYNDQIFRIQSFGESREHQLQNIFEWKFEICKY